MISFFKAIVASYYLFIQSFNSVYITEAPTAFLDEKPWHKLEQTILKTNYKFYNILWQGEGGYLDEGKEFIDVVHKAQKQGKQINIFVIGDSYSMHASAVCAADHIYFWNHSFLMFHVAASAFMNIREPNFQPANHLLFDECIEKGILTPAKVNKIRSGFEFYYTPKKTWYKIDNRPTL